MYSKKFVSFTKIYLSIFLFINIIFLNACKQKPIDKAETFELSGTLRYQDRLYNKGGFYGTKYLPIRNAPVDVIDENNNVLLSSVTDQNGNIALTNIPFNAVSISLRAENNTYNNQISINNTSAALYAVSENIDKTTSPATVSIELDINHPAAGAFNMLDLYQYATEYSQSLSAAEQVFVPLNVFWTKGSGTYGTYMCMESDNSGCRQGIGIYVTSGQSDTDEYDDDVLLHEFGHYLEYVFNANGSLGGAHVFTDNDLDLRLSWSEGWGNYTALAVKQWLANNRPFALSASQAANESLSNYLDTDTSFRGVRISLDFLNTGLCGNIDCYIYVSNEVAVARSLLNISKKITGEQLIWDIFSTDFSQLTTPINFDSFWDYAISKNTEIDQGQLLNILLERKINYYLDSSEPDNNYADISVIECLTPGACIENEFHTLYSAETQADIDWVAINLQAGQAYSFETNKLSNGADTYLKLYDRNGNLLAEDDDRSDSLNNDQALSCSNVTGVFSCPHNGYNFSSQIKYTASKKGIYYLSVSVPDEIYTEAYDMVGRYGGYELTVKTLP